MRRKSSVRLLILPFKGLFLFLRWVLSFGLRSIIVIAIVGLVIWGAMTYFDILPKAEPEAPIIVEAPYVVGTSSRVYLAKSYEKVNGTIILNGYYELRGKRGEWVWVDRQLILDEKFGNVTVEKRK